LVLYWVTSHERFPSKILTVQWLHRELLDLQFCMTSNGRIQVKNTLCCNTFVCCVCELILQRKLYFSVCFSCLELCMNWNLMNDIFNIWPTSKWRTCLLTVKNSTIFFISVVTTSSNCHRSSLFCVTQICSTLIYLIQFLKFHSNPILPSVPETSKYSV